MFWFVGIVAIANFALGVVAAVQLGLANWPVIAFRTSIAGASTPIEHGHAVAHSVKASPAGST